MKNHNGKWVGLLLSSTYRDVRWHLPTRELFPMSPGKISSCENRYYLPCRTMRKARALSRINPGWKICVRDHYVGLGGVNKYEYRSTLFTPYYDTYNRNRTRWIKRK